MAALFRLIPVVLLSALLLLSRFPGLAQSSPAYVFRHVTADEGLASNKVFGILRDDRGFVWISTLNGFQRYDGYSFTTWHHNPADSSSLPIDASICLLRDPGNNIWLASWPWGFTIFNPHSGKCSRVFDPYLVDAADACLDKDGNTWLISHSSLEEYDRLSHTLIPFRQLLPPDVGFTQPAFYDAHANCLYLNSIRFGICVFDLHEKKFYYQLNNPGNLLLPGLKEKATPLLLDKKHCLWVNPNSGGVLRIDLASGRMTPYFLRDPVHPKEKPVRIRINSAIQDRQGNVWFASSIGLLYNEPGTTELQVIRDNPVDVNGFHSDGEIHCLYEDEEGSIWVGTDHGIDIFNPGKQKFVSIPVLSLDSTGRKYSVINFLQRDNGDIWLAAYDGGIFVYDNLFRFKHNYTVDNNRPDPYRLPHSSVWCFLPLSDGRIVIGMQHGWLSVFHPETGIFDSRQPPGLQRWTISNMLFDKDSTIWMSLFHGLGKWDTRKDQFTAYPDFVPFRGSTQSVTIDIAADSQNRIWAATLDHGLQQFDPAAGKFQAADTPVSSRPGSISSIVLQSVINMDSSLMAMGTADAGIDIYDRATGQFSYITTADGLPSNNVAALYYQSPGNLWAATAQGLCQVDLRTRHVTVYGAEDGIVVTIFPICSGFAG